MTQGAGHRPQATGHQNPVTRSLFPVPWNQVAVALSSGLYLSFIPGTLLKDRKFTGAGLIGSLWGVALLGVLPLDPAKQIAVWFGALLISVVASDIAEAALKRHDDPRIVIDEFIGIWTAMLLLPHTMPVVIAAFVLFRLFDVVKPGWIGHAAKLPGGWGVIADDVLAGVVTNGILRLALAVYPL